MKLDELNDIARAEKKLIDRAEQLDRYSKDLAQKRNDMCTLSKFVSDVQYQEYNAELNKEVLRIINSMSHDVFRVAEIKFSAEARELRIEAKLRRQQINNFLSDGEEK